MLHGSPSGVCSVHPPQHDALTSLKLPLLLTMWLLVYLVAAYKGTWLPLFQDKQLAHPVVFLPHTEAQGTVNPLQRKPEVLNDIEFVWRFS